VTEALASDSGAGVGFGPAAEVERTVVATAFTPLEPAVRQVLAKTPDRPATVIAERVGWTGSSTWFRDCDVAASKAAS